MSNESERPESIPGIKSVRRQNKDGTTYERHYHRRTGIALSGEYGSKEFLGSWAAAERAERAPHAATISGLIEKYERSPEFANLSPASRTEYVRKFKKVRAAWGDTPLTMVTDPKWRMSVIEWRNRIARYTPREADNLLACLARVISWSTDLGLLKLNILKNIKKIHRSNRRDFIWFDEVIESFCAVAYPELQWVLFFALHTSLRQGDCLKALWCEYDGQVIRTTHRKTGTPALIPCNADLRALLDKIPRRADTILTTPKGDPWNAAYLKHEFVKAKRAAGIAHLHFHDLRGTAITRLALAGASIPQICSISGHSLSSAGILDHYVSRTGTMAFGAIELLDRFLAKNRKQ